jgi:hypothetical protein
MIRNLWSIPMVFTCAALAITKCLFAVDFPKDLYDCCRDECCKQSHITTDTKKVAKRVYGEKCQDFCLPHTHHGGCDCCVSCGKIRTRKYLVVKIREHEECVNKCVVEHEPHSCAPCACPLAAEKMVVDRDTSSPFAAGGYAAEATVAGAPITAIANRVTAPDRGLSMQRLRSESGTIGRFLSLKASRQPSAH